MLSRMLLIVSFLLGHCFYQNADRNSHQQESAIAIAKSNLCIDMTINNVLKLKNAKSITDAFGDLSTKLDIELQESPYIIFINEEGSQYLKLIKWEGSARNNFSYFEVGRYIDMKYSSVFYPSYFREFKTECGIHLGLGKDSLILIKGPNFKISNENLVEVMKYTGENLYCAKYYLEAGKIIKYEFGFEYP